MQRYHDPSRDPLPIRSPLHDQERDRLVKLTEAFLAKGGTIEQVGYQMKDAMPTFVIDPKKTPVYAHLFTRPEAEAEPAQAMPAPTERVIAQVELPAGLAKAAKPHTVDTERRLQDIRKAAEAIRRRLDRLENQHTH